MAPHMLRDYHCIGDPGRYSLRVIKHSDNVPRPPHVDTSQIKGKEDFLLGMGLQMRRSQHTYITSDSSCRPKTVNIPAGVMLRDCRIDILGVTCNICGKCFKCKTDLDVHTKLKHYTYTVKNTTTTETQCTEYDNEIIEIFADSYKDAIITGRKSGDLKMQKKLRLTFRIGEEVVATVSVKRKHLKKKAVSISTQTELYDTAELSADKDDYESSVFHIDPSLCCKNPCRCCNPLLPVANGTDQYLVSNIVACEDSVAKENMALNKTSALNQLTESRTIFKNCSCTPNKESHDYVESCLTSSLNSKEENDDVILLTNDTDNNNNNNDINKNEKRRDINANEVLIDISEEEQNKTNSISEDSVIPQLDLEPLQQLALQQDIISQDQSEPSSQPSALPQQPPTHRRHSTPVHQSSVPQQLVFQASSGNSGQSEPLSSILQPQSVMIRQMSAPNLHSVSLEQQSTPGQQIPSFQQSSISNAQPASPQQSPTLRPQASQQTTTPVVEQTFDDEIQEVLRIVRGYNSREDINHESPNRYEQELLLRDVIEDMRKMEERGLHLLEIKYAKNRKRSSKSTGANDETTKKKKKISVRSNEENTKSSTKGKSTSTTTENATKIQKQNGASVGDILKENLMIGNANITSTNEVLHKYGINLYNDTFEIDDNTENIQEPIRHFLTPCSTGVENRNN